MPFTVVKLAAKLCDLRSSFGTTNEEVAAATGIAIERLTAFETASLSPSGDEVLILADHFGCDFTWLIEDDAVNDEENLKLLFRNAGDQLSVRDRHAIKEFVHLCRCQAFLEESLDRASAGFKFRPVGKYYKGHGEQCARAFRDWLKLPAHAVVPDIFAKLRTVGMRLFRRALPDSQISGLFIQHPKAGPCILVNYTEDYYR